MANSGRVFSTASYDFITLCVGSEATGNLLWHAWTENLDRVSMSSPETPTHRGAERLELRDRLGKLVRLDRAAFGIRGRERNKARPGPSSAHRPANTGRLPAHGRGRGEIGRAVADVERRAARARRA